MKIRFRIGADERIEEVGVIYCDPVSPSIVWVGVPHPFEQQESGVDLVVTLARGATLTIRPSDDPDLIDPTNLPVAIISGGSGAF